MSLLVLSAADVDKIASTFTLDELQYLMAQIFTRLSSSSAGDDSDSGISMPPRIIIQTNNHNALFMPARIGPPPLLRAGSGLSSDGIVNQPGNTAIKVVSVPKMDSSKGLPASTLVLDEATGSVKAVVNARKLTALRNAAGSLLSTSLVGPTHPGSIVAFGAGQQIDTHLDLHLRRFPSITKCTIVNRSLNARAVSLRERLANQFTRAEIILHSSNAIPDSSLVPQFTFLEQTLRSADIIICATSSTTPLFPSSWVKNGTHVILIGSYTPSMREVDKTLIQRSIPSHDPLNNRTKCLPILLVDLRDACCHESGELIDAQITPSQMTEIGEIIPKNEANVVTPETYLNLEHSNDIHAGFDGLISIFKSVGIGLQDVAIASAIVEKAYKMEGSIGTTVPDYDS